MKVKGVYVCNFGLVGLFLWEIDVDNGDILNVMYEGLVGGIMILLVNKVLVVNVGVDIMVMGLVVVFLDGSVLKDSDGSIVSYLWE